MAPLKLSCMDPLSHWRVVHQDQIPRGCTGVVHGTVAYVPNSGAAGLGSGPTGALGRNGSLIVGRFSFDMP